MQLIILLAIIMAMLMLDLSPTLFDQTVDPMAIAATAGAYLAIIAILGLLHSRAAICHHRKLIDSQNSPPPNDPPAESRLARFFGAMCNLWLLTGMLPIFAAGFAQWMFCALGAGKYPLIGEAMAISPAIAAACILWLTEYPTHRAVRRMRWERMIAQEPAMQATAPPPVWTLREYMSFNIRHNLLFILVPIAIIIFCKDAIFMYCSEMFPAGDFGLWLMTAATFGCTLTIFALTPLMIVRVWKTDPLPNGELRDKLERLCVAMKMKYRQILIWRSKGIIANACVMGIVAPARYVLISDALLETLSERQVVSVFGHEAGHAVRRHIPYMLLFAISTMLISIVVTTVICQLLPIAADPQSMHPAEIFEPAILLTMWATLFGPLSRRLERQSDVYGAWAASENFTPNQPMQISMEGAVAFASALEKLAELNGIPRSRHNWRHGSIDKRIEYILTLAQRGGDCLAINRSVRRMKAVLWLATIAAVAAIILQECGYV